MTTTENNEEIVRKSDLLVLAVKPKDVESVLKTIRPTLSPERHVLVSIAAGIRTGTIEKVGTICEENSF